MNGRTIVAAIAPKVAFETTAELCEAVELQRVVAALLA